MNKTFAVLLAAVLLLAGFGCSKTVRKDLEAERDAAKAEMVAVRKASMQRKAEDRSGGSRADQPRAAQNRSQLAPDTAADYPAAVYGSDNPEAQVIGIYLAESDEPTPLLVWIHGGGWSAGSYARIPDFAEELLDMGISVASVENRFTQEAIHPAQVNDCQRAIQFLRASADRLNIDPERFGAAGGSAGAHLALCMATWDDAANPRSEDPVERESSRVSCAASYAGPTDWTLLAQIDHSHPAYRVVVGHEPGTPYEEMNKKLMAEISPITHISKDDAAILQCHGNDDPIVPIQHAKRMDKAMKRKGLESRLVAVDGVGHSPGRNEEVRKATIEFFKKHLLD